MRLISRSMFGLAFLACAACGRPSQTSNSSPGRTVEKLPRVGVPKDAQKSLARAERRSLAAKPEVTSPESRALVDSVVASIAAHRAANVAAGALPAVSGKAQIGVLYFQDSPAHRAALFRWLEARGAEVLYEDETLGYLDARLNWTGVAELIDTSGDLGLDATSFLKLEIDVVVDNAPVPRVPFKRSAPGEVETSGFFGAVHSAGFGTNLDAFRRLVAEEFGMKPSDFEGQGMLVASSDSGFNASRTDVFQNRLVDFLVGDEDDWNAATKTLSEFLEQEALKSVPAGLEDWAENPALRFVVLEEKEFDADLNGSGSKIDALTLAVLQREGKPVVRVRPHAGASFGDDLLDFGEAAAAGLPRFVDLRTGRHFARSALRPSNSVLGVKLRTNAKSSMVEVAFVGVSPGAEHGTANLHMVGGNYTSPDGTAVFKGVAPSVMHVAMQTWGVNGATYGMKWIPLARNVSQAAQRGADVINLDIYTPGTRNGNDMISQLACRVSTLTNAVIVVAAHNFGPSPNTVQSLAQSPCVLGIGAAHSVAELKNARNLASIDPALVAEGDDALQTTAYSGRGFGLNGLLKPDIVAPNYGYTAYGEGFTRFGGTSGATPTTAGLIALLKQAARMKGIELNFAQVRFLLQGSSGAVREGRYRDGYGYIDLEAAWKLLGALTRASGSGTFEPLLVTGHRPLEFVNRPPHARLALPLGQMPQRGVADVPRRMMFEIEFGGDSRSLQKPWLAFVENATGTLTSTLRLDIPLSSGVSESLPLAFLLTSDDWARLPPGDHIALVKGYRTDLLEVSKAFGRVADFIQPISVRKARTETDAVLPVTPLSAYQFQTFAFETLPGEVLFLSATPVCEGVQVPNADGGAPASAFELLVDADPTLPHASEVMNTYAPLRLSATPVRIVSRGRFVTFTLARYSDRECLGALGGTLSVRRFGFDRKTIHSSLTEKDEMFFWTVEQAVRLEQGALTARTGNRAVNWVIGKEEPSLVISRLVRERLEMKVPAETKKVRVLPGALSRHQGLLYAFNAKGEVKNFAAASSTNAAGLGADASPAPLQNGFLEIDAPCDECTLVFEPFLTKDSKSTPPRLELVLPTTAAKVKTNFDSSSFTSWATGDTKMLAMTLSLPSSRPSPLEGFDPSLWSTELLASIVLNEGNANDSSTADVLKLGVQTFDVRVPVSFR